MKVEVVNQERLKQVLVDSVSINSVSDKEQEVTNYFENVLRGRGFDVQRQVIDEASGRANLLAEKGVGASVLFYGHMDTVPITNPEKWKTDPHKPVETDGNIFGLGASDMKAGVAAFIEAATNSKSPIKILLAVDEENISEGAWSALTNRPDFFDGLNLVISAESSFNLGLHSITRSRTGRCVYVVNFEGKPEHIIKYKDAVDAIEKLCNFGTLLYANREAMFISPDTVAQIRKVQAESIGMSVCGSAHAIIEAILGAGDSVESVKAKLQEMTDAKVEVQKRKTPYLEGYRFDDFPYEKAIAKIITTHTGKDMTLDSRKSVGDDNVLATLGIPVITWGPVGDNEHKENEFVNFESVAILSEMYREFLDEIGRGDNK